MDNSKTDVMVKIFQFLLALVIIGTVDVVIWVLSTHDTLPTENQSMLTYMLGNIVGFAGAVIVWYFPSSLGSTKKDDTIAALTQHVRQLTTTQGGQPNGVISAPDQSSAAPTAGGAGASSNGNGGA